MFAHVQTLGTCILRNKTRAVLSICQLIAEADWRGGRSSKKGQKRNYPLKGEEQNCIQNQTRTDLKSRQIDRVTLLSRLQRQEEFRRNHEKKRKKKKKTTKNKNNYNARHSGTSLTDSWQYDFILKLYLSIVLSLVFFSKCDT